MDYLWGFILESLVVSSFELSQRRSVATSAMFCQYVYHGDLRRSPTTVFSTISTRHIHLSPSYTRHRNHLYHVPVRHLIREDHANHSAYAVDTRSSQNCPRICSYHTLSPLVGISHTYLLSEPPAHALKSAIVSGAREHYTGAHAPLTKQTRRGPSSRSAHPRLKFSYTFPASPPSFASHPIREPELAGGSVL